MKLGFLVLAFLLFSCNKDKSSETCQGNSFKDATILWSGPREADGCDWIIKIDSEHFYHPDVLDDRFKHNDLKVKICYSETTDKYYCGFNSVGMPVIHVIDIKE